LSKNRGALAQASAPAAASDPERGRAHGPASAPGRAAPGACKQLLENL